MKNRKVLLLTTVIGLLALTIDVIFIYKMISSHNDITTAVQIPEYTPAVTVPAPCEHDFLLPDGVCSYCGYICTHDMHDGVCSCCGYICTHDMHDGVCTVCGYCCPHGQHSESGAFEAPVCSECGAKVCHEWVNGECLVCGERFEFIEHELPYNLVSAEGLPENECGTVSTLRYPSHYYETGKDCEKNITVYLPAGYDENNEYPLLLMCVGSSGASSFYFDDNPIHTYFDTDIRNAKAMFDRLIAGRLCHPFIAATIEPRSSDVYYEMRYVEDRIQISREITEYILPFLIENYSLCIKDTSPETLAENRDRLAFIGVSYGGYICNTSAFQDNYNVFGKYCAVSGGWAYGKAMSDAAAASELPIIYFYACDGETYLDGCAPAAKDDYYVMNAWSDKLTDGVNGHAGTVSGGNHEISTWLTAMFNFIRYAL